jgi:hypothetical protein
MSENWLHFLDYFFFVFHLLIILFNIFGWIVPRWRKYNLALLLLTGLSWFGLGIWYGWGYCPFTDWHWQVRAELEYVYAGNSYIRFLIDQTTGVDLGDQLADIITVTAYFIALVISIYLNLKAAGRKS